jgi:hypothetical protein
MIWSFSVSLVPPTRNQSRFDARRNHCASTGQSLRVMVVGDLIVDRFVYGHVDRLSRDAPIPVMVVEQ